MILLGGTFCRKVLAHGKFLNVTQLTKRFLMATRYVLKICRPHRTHHRRVKLLSTASRVLAMSSFVWAVETKQASKAEGAM